MNYRETRFYLNCEKRIYPSASEEGFPQLERCDLTLDGAEMLGFNYAKNERHPEDKIVHFFLDDYQFDRVWYDPIRYANMLKRFKAVVVPDFSTYEDFPKVLQQYNHYRNLWLGKYWQEYGLDVIPNISFSDESSFEWVFNGQPKGGLMCISTVGCFVLKEAKRLWIDGFERALDKLAPDELLIYGKVHAPVQEVLDKVGFKGKVTVGVPRNLADREAKSMRGKKIDGSGTDKVD